MFYSILFYTFSLSSRFKVLTVMTNYISLKKNRVEHYTCYNFELSKVGVYLYYNFISLILGMELLLLEAVELIRYLKTVIKYIVECGFFLGGVL